MGKAGDSDRAFSYHSTAVDSIDSLSIPIVGTEAEIVQIGSGRLTGQIIRATIGEVGFSRGSFSVPICASGVFSRTKLTIGTLLACKGTLNSWGGSVTRGDILVVPAGFDHRSVYLGPAAFAGLSIDCIELALLYGQEGPLSDGDFWTRRHHFRSDDPRRATKINQQLNLVFAKLAQPEALAPASADYLKRCVIDAFVTHMGTGTHLQASTPIAPALRVIREAENYVNRQAHQPVHISELCNYLKISRRTLHRCFEDVLGVGPSTFLRQKRLSSVYSALRRSDPEKTRVTDVAIEFGFIELGRFSQQYRDLFGEYPHETLQR